NFATLVTFENTTASQFTKENFAGLAPRALGSLPTVALLARSDSGVAGDGITKSTRPTFVGQADPGSVVKLFVDDVVIGTAKAGATGVWSFTPTTALVDGPRIVTASVVNGNGLEVARSESFTVTIDTIGPDVTGPVLVAGDDTGLAGDRVTARTAPAFTGTAERDAVVTIVVDNVAVATVNADQNGTWHYTADTLVEGKHRIGVRATDIAGNASATRTATFTIDTAIEAPTLTGLSARSDTGVKGDDISRVAKTGLTGTAEAGATVTVFVDGVAMGTAKANSLGQWSFANPVLSDGLHDAYVTAVDAAGNASLPSGTYSFTVDTLAPTLGATLLSADSDSGVLGDGITNIAPVLEGVAEAGSTVTLTIDGVEAASIVADAVTGAWSYTPTNLGEGRHSVSVRATDIAGNASATKKTYVTVDTVAAVPVVAGLSAKSDSGTIGDNITKSNRPALTGSAEAGATVTLYADDVAIGSTKAASNGVWSITLSEPLSDGTHAFSAAITDLAGNASERSSAVNVTVDTVASTAGQPVLVETSDSGKVGDGITNDYTPTLSGVAEAGNSVTVRIDGKDVATVVADSTGQWEYTPTALLSVGQHRVVAVARDAAGNIGKASSVLALTIEKQVTALAAPALTAESDTGKLGDGITSDASPTLAGVVDAGATVTITLDGRQVGTVTADSATGAWSYKLATPLDDGAHLVSVRAGGAVVEQLALTIDTIDPSKPGKVMIDAASDTGIIGDGRTTTAAPLLRGTAEANGTVQLYIDNRKVATVAADATGAWSYLPDAALSVGDHIVQIRVADAAGNVSDKSDPLALRIQSRTGTTTLTTGVDDVVADDSGIMVTGTSATLTASTPGMPGYMGSPGIPPVAGDQLIGGAGYDTLQLFGGGEYRINNLGAFTGFERVLVTNPGGSSEARVYLGAQTIELGVSHGYNANFYLGSGKVTFESSVSGSVTVTSTDNWNVANVLKGITPTPQNMYMGSIITVTFAGYSGAQTYDLRSASLASVSINSSTANTFLVNSAVMAGVRSWYSSSDNKLNVADSSIDLGSSSLSNFKVISTNVTGTTFTTTSSSTAFQVQGGAGQDTLVLKGSAFTIDQRNAIFATSSIETITDTSGTYQADPNLIRLTAGVDKITAPDSGIMVTGTSATLTASTPGMPGYMG
ncbi:Ig-like domain-containing protein, partial [Sphingomonas sp. SAFR-052]|uniref:Ig-like domain-containing protein n=1 Tax=Sphingomonas sp. SAFR-052 TaxID=3436867 RepID=UPI003F7FC19E